MKRTFVRFIKIPLAAVCAATGVLCGCGDVSETSMASTLQAEQAVKKRRGRLPVKIVDRITVYASNSKEADLMNAVLNGNISRIDELRKGGMPLDTVYSLSEDDRVPEGTQICLTNFLRGFDLQLADDDERSHYRIYPKTVDDRLPYGYVRLYGTPLMAACRAGNRVMVKALLERGANPNVFIETRNTSRIPDCISRRPLIYAYSETFLAASKYADSAKRRRKFDDVAAMLKASGIVFPGVDGMGRNAVFDALEALSPSFLETAIRNGCDVNAKDRHGLTACDWIVVEKARLSNKPSKRLREILDEELRILMKNGATASRLDKNALKRLVEENVPSVQGMIDRLEAEDRLLRVEFARFIEGIKRKSRLADSAAELELARNEARWKAMEQELQRQIDHNRFYPGISYEDWKLAEKEGLVYVGGTGVYGTFPDWTLFRDASGDFYKVEGGFIRKYSDDGSLGPARRSK
ncbi:MAG: hypothetical protein J5985_00265 [Kiritimatiellae bacterium]|nr:hypothetical protein [Kiritimatiellia bacterium]